MHWLDWMITAVLGYFIVQGYCQGFTRQCYDLAGCAVALILAFAFYRQIGTVLTTQINVSSVFANIWAFTLIAVLIWTAAGFWGKMRDGNRRHRPRAFYEGWLGALAGALKAAIGILMVLLILLALPTGKVRDQIEDSDLAGDLLRLAPYFYMFPDHNQDGKSAGMVVSPEGLVLGISDYEKLDGATCVNCGAAVQFRGMVVSGRFSYPQFYCPRCHRISDGCLTFEGYHMLKGKCPYEEFLRKGTIDCKVWKNSEPSIVKGKCPVCGRTQ